MQLPSATSSWSDLWSAFPPDIAKLLQALVGQLQDLLGPIEVRDKQGIFEPDGYGGINRLSHYERLLVSEWVLLDDLPEEFLRRAVAGEHLFLQPNKIDCQGQYHCIVLFDCGPEQLGMPRVVQLALLIIMARRAAALSMRFSWAVLQNPTQPMCSVVDRHSVEGWLAHRSMSLPNQKMLEMWIEYCETSIDDMNANSLANCEYWLVGSESFCLDNRHLNTVSIREDYISNGMLHVRSSIAGRLRVKSLTAPNAAICTRLIRDPFDANSSGIVRDKLDGKPSYWILSVFGNSWACVNSQGHVEVRVIQRSRNQKIAAASIYKVAGENRLRAIFLENKKRPATVCLNSQSMYLHDFPGVERTVVIPRIQGLRPRGDNNLLPAVIVRASGHSGRLFLLDGNDKLRMLEWPKTDALFETVADQVILLEAVGNIGCYVCYDRATSVITINWNLCSKQFSQRQRLIDLDRAPAIFIYNQKQSWTKTCIGCLAYESSPSLWKIIYGKKVDDVAVDSGCRVLGVIKPSANDAKSAIVNTFEHPMLIALAADGRTVIALWSIGQQEIVTLSTTPTDARINPCYPYLHYFEHNGEFVTINLLRGFGADSKKKERVA